MFKPEYSKLRDEFILTGQHTQDGKIYSLFLPSQSEIEGKFIAFRKDIVDGKLVKKKEYKDYEEYKKDLKKRMKINVPD